MFFDTATAANSTENTMSKSAYQSIDSIVIIALISCVVCYAMCAAQFFKSRRMERAARRLRIVKDSLSHEVSLTFVASLDSDSVTLRFNALGHSCPDTLDRV
ncbi:unnamed protein product [Prorocentrum cordatum]|uniref:Uncharacterized protein n=1 Tax=Prorocentrum cordatum TaxID=2364126 RepID=A0ABN9U6U7_9DINO|nr:unnamed protein product [Polarella glacialis]